MRDTKCLHTTRDNKVHPISKDVWDKLPELLAGAKPYYDSNKNGIILILNPEADVHNSNAINVNYNQKIILGEGDRATVRSNLVATGSSVDNRNIKQKIYTELKI